MYYHYDSNVLNALLLTERAKRKYKYFWNRHQVFSHWHPCLFDVGGKTYNCVEKYMMHQKAGKVHMLTFKDNS